MRRIIILIVLSVAVAGVVHAGSLVSLSDTVSRHAPSITSDHTIKFKTEQGIGGAGETFTTTFDAGFDLTALTVSDILFSHGSITGLEVSETLASNANNTDWGVSISGQDIILEHPTNSANGDVAVNDFIVIKIGTNAGGSNQIINPVALGSKIIRIQTSSGEQGALAVPVTQDQVGAGASVAGNVTATIKWAVPHLRAGSPLTNNDTNFFLTVRTADNTDDVILFSQPSLRSLNVAGAYLTPIPLSTITPGVYDIGIKGHQHITKVLNDVTLVSGNNQLNYTQPDNSPTLGSLYLYAGDINGLGISPSTLGDDVINSIDLSLLLQALDGDDITGNAIRANLNQDIVVNSIDLSMLLNNLDKEGDN